jgi:hypothetical protein
MRSYRKRLPHVFAFPSCTLSFMSDPYEIGWLFADLNAFFASVEQELRPELRGQPIGIVPIEAETACCIAASYQAKAYGVKTGLRLDEALLLCPHLIVVQARPRLYVEYHHLIVAAIERCIPVQAVMSCDEFACQLIGRERHLRRAVDIAYSIKAELRTVGSTLRCSIGLAPNRLLAKVAGDMTKPDGLMIFERRHLPRALYGLKLGDIPGIGGRMEERIRAEGITTMRELCALPRERIHGIWGSVLGDRLWHWFRGVDFPTPVPPLISIVFPASIYPLSVAPISGVMAPVWMRSAMVNRVLENFRMVTAGLGRTTGGRTAARRLPSGSCAFKSGCASSNLRLNLFAITSKPVRSAFASKAMSACSNLPLRSNHHWPSGLPIISLTESSSNSSLIGCRNDMRRSKS